MKVVVIGANGRTGTEVVRQGLAAGHEVTAFVRDPAKLTVSDAHLTVKTGDARNKADLRPALEGRDAVISTLGGKPKDAVIERSAAALVEAATETGVRRVVMLSSFLLASNLKLTRFQKLFGRFVKGMVADKRTGEDQLMHSKLDWTIIYAATLTDGPRSGAVRTVTPSERVTPADRISRADVAGFLLEQAATEATIGQSLVITGPD